MTIKTFSKWIYILRVYWDTYLYVKRSIFGLFHDYFAVHTSLMVPSFLSLENFLSDSYTFIRTLTRLSIYMYYSRLLVNDIVSCVTVSLLNVLVTNIRFVL